MSQTSVINLLSDDDSFVHSGFGHSDRNSSHFSSLQYDDPYVRENTADEQFVDLTQLSAPLDEPILPSYIANPKSKFDSCISLLDSPAASQDNDNFINKLQKAKFGESFNIFSSTVTKTASSSSSEQQNTNGVDYMQMIMEEDHRRANTNKNNLKSKPSENAMNVIRGCQNLEKVGNEINTEEDDLFNMISVVEVSQRKCVKEKNNGSNSNGNSNGNGMSLYSLLNRKQKDFEVSLSQQQPMPTTSYTSSSTSVANKENICSQSQSQSILNNNNNKGSSKSNKIIKKTNSITNTNNTNGNSNGNRLHSMFTTATLQQQLPLLPLPLPSLSRHYDGNGNTSGMEQVEEDDDAEESQISASMHSLEVIPSYNTSTSTSSQPAKKRAKTLSSASSSLAFTHLHQPLSTTSTTASSTAISTAIREEEDTHYSHLTDPDHTNNTNNTAEKPHSTTNTTNTSNSTISSCRRVSPDPETEYEVVLLIDRREKASSLILSQLLANQIPCELAQLAVGDFLWIARPSATTNTTTTTNTSNKTKKGKKPTSLFAQVLAKEELKQQSLVLDCIIERKSMADLAASLLDGRYQEQKYRLTQTNMTMCGYLVEGEAMTVPMQVKAITTTHLKSALVHSHLHDNLHIIRTRSMDHTILMLQHLHKQVQRRFQTRNTPHNTPLIASSTLSYPLYGDFQQVYQKKQALSFEQLFGYQLRQIHGCSVSIATSIMEKFGTMANFMAYLQMTDRYKAEKTIEHLSNVIGQEKVRKVGPTLAKKICRLCADDF